MKERKCCYSGSSFFFFYSNLHGVEVICGDITKASFIFLVLFTFPYFYHSTLVCHLKKYNVTMKVGTFYGLVWASCMARQLRNSADQCSTVVLCFCLNLQMGTKE